MCAFCRFCWILSPGCSREWLLGDWLIYGISRWRRMSVGDINGPKRAAEDKRDDGARPVVNASSPTNEMGSHKAGYNKRRNTGFPPNCWGRVRIHDNQPQFIPQPITTPTPPPLPPPHHEPLTPPPLLQPPPLFKLCLSPCGKSKPTCCSWSTKAHTVIHHLPLKSNSSKLKYIYLIF